MFLLCLIPLTISATCVTSINVESNVQINKKEVKPSILMEGTSGDMETNYLRTNIKKKDIETITFTNSFEGHSVNGTDCFDVSKNKDKTVLLWVTDNDNNNLYEITIGTVGKLYAYSGHYLFSNLYNLKSINGIENLDTSKVTTMSSMFEGCSSLTSLDLTHSNFNTQKVTGMSYMFSGCSGLTSLNLSSSNFNTSNVKAMGNMFAGCTGLLTLNINGSNFNT